MAFYGVYRGIVVDNTDPQVNGRVKVNVEAEPVGRFARSRLLRCRSVPW